MSAHASRDGSEAGGRSPERRPKSLAMGNRPSPQSAASSWRGGLSASFRKQDPEKELVAGMAPRAHPAVDDSFSKYASVHGLRSELQQDRAYARGLAVSACKSSLITCKPSFLAISLS